MGIVYSTLNMKVALLLCLVAIACTPQLESAVETHMKRALNRAMQNAGSDYGNDYWMDWKKMLPMIKKMAPMLKETIYKVAEQLKMPELVTICKAIFAAIDSM